MTCCCVKMAIIPVVLRAAIALLILVSCNVIKVKFATTSAIDCPQNQTCRCYQFTPTSLTVSCGGHDLNETMLAQELDLLLSAEELKENLILLGISGTPLTKVPMSVCELSNLQALFLDNNRLSRLRDNCFTNMTALAQLSASKNNITELQDGLFDGLNSLTVLNLEQNMIASIGLHVFSNPYDLVKLKTILLRHNRLRSLEPWPYIRGLLGSAVHVFLASNRICEFTNNIEWQFNCCRRSYANVDMTNNSIRHLSDVLHGWNITVTQWLRMTNPVDDDPAFKLDVKDSRDYHCDCVDINFYMHNKYYGDNRIFSNVKCVHPQSLANRYVNQVPVTDFVCELSDRCPPNCRCVYRPANCTVHIYCSAANLSSLPDDLPPLPSSHDMYKLDFSNNKRLQHLEHRPYLANTSALDVSNCAIESVDLDAWREFAMMPSEIYNFASSMLKHNLTPPVVVMPVVFLHGNKIESLTPDVTAVNLTTVHLTLNDNPWKCSCDNKWMISWFKSLSSGTSTNVGDVLCASPSRLKGRSILQSHEVDFCVDPLKRMLKIVLSSTLSAMAGLLLLGFVVYLLRVRLYKRWKFHPFDRDECIGEDMDYDVFLCCSSDDNSSHGLRLLQLMESKGYRVCYHLRDFIAGGLIMDNIHQSIVRSKRTVCLLSRNFIQR